MRSVIASELARNRSNRGVLLQIVVRLKIFQYAETLPGQMSITPKKNPSIHAAQMPIIA